MQHLPTAPAVPASPIRPRAMTVAEAHLVRRNPGAFDAKTEAEARDVLRAELLETFTLRDAGDPSVSPIIHGAPVSIAPIASSHARPRRRTRLDAVTLFLALAIGAGVVTIAHVALTTALFIARAQ